MITESSAFHGVRFSPREYRRKSTAIVERIGKAMFTAIIWDELL